MVGCAREAYNGFGLRVNFYVMVYCCNAAALYSFDDSEDEDSEDDEEEEIALDKKPQSKAQVSQ